MGIRALINKAREKARSAGEAKTAEERSRERVKRAVGKIQLEQAKAILRAAKIRRETEELHARVALEKARTAVNKAKAEQIKASSEKWRARYQRIGSITGLSPGSLKRGARTVGKGVFRAGKLLLTDKPARRKKKVTARKRASRAKTLR